MFRKEDFEDLRPYYDDEINPALGRIISNPLFGKILDFLFPGADQEKIKKTLSLTYTAHDFQVRFMHPLVLSIISKTSAGVSVKGFEKLTPGTPYLFVANHRDIVLDSAILQMLLVDHGHETTEITFGSNLMINQFVVDFGKVNRMFKVERGGNKADLLDNSRKLSAYIRYAISTKKSSVWIAQRPGRTKNGNDKTETGLLKMFSLSGGKDFRKSFAELNIVPVSISYEYEPCCASKINEILTVQKNGSYQKRPDEDLVSIVTGITQPKGRIELAVGNPVNTVLHEINSHYTLNNKLNRLAEMMDKEIYGNYRLWPGNYIAFDMLEKEKRFSSFYSDEDRRTFLGYMEKVMRDIEGEKEAIKNLFLGIYANPVKNANRPIH